MYESNGCNCCRLCWCLLFNSSDHNYQQYSGRFYFYNGCPVVLLFIYGEGYATQDSGYDTHQTKFEEGMNRKYVILTPEIGNMGGAQMYVENKVKYLRENNWEVCVFYYIYGENYKLPVLTEFKDNCFHDFLYAFYYIPFYERKKILDVIDYDYPTFHLTMHCILCTIVSGNLKLLEHEAAKWVTKETLRSVDWLPADQLILDKIEEIL